MYLIIADYDNTKINLHKYIVKNKGKNNLAIMKAIKKSLFNLHNVYTKLSFIHGDFHTGNNLVWEKDNNIMTSIIDLDFSLILNDTNTIIIKGNEDPYINLYLCLPKKYIVTKKFLRFFDIYLFSIRLFSIIDESFDNNINNYINKDLDECYLYFFIVYIIIKSFFKNDTDKAQKDSFCRYVNIMKIFKKVPLLDFFEENQFYYLIPIYNDMKEMFYEMIKLNHNKLF